MNFPQAALQDARHIRARQPLARKHFAHLGEDALRLRIDLRKLSGTGGVSPLRKAEGRGRKLLFDRECFHQFG